MYGCRVKVFSRKPCKADVHRNFPRRRNMGKGDSNMIFSNFPEENVRIEVVLILIEKGIWKYTSKRK